MLELTAQIELAAAIDTADASNASDGKPALPRFSMVAYTGGPMRVAGWRYPVVMDLAGLAVPSQARPVRFGHDANMGVGHTDSIHIADSQLLAAGVISRDTPTSREVVMSAKNGFPWQASIGAAVEKHEFVKEGQTASANGRQFAGPVYVVRKATLGEISFVDLGADGNTSANVAAKANQEKDIMADTTATADNKQDTTAAKTVEGAAAQGAAQAAGGAATAAVTPPIQAAAVSSVQASGITADAVADIRAQAAAELERIAAIQTLCGDKHRDICAKAIKDGTSANDTELAILRAERPEAPHVHVPDNNVTGTVLEAAAALTAHMDGIEKVYDKQTLDVAAKNFRGGPGRHRSPGTFAPGRLGQWLHGPDLPRLPRDPAVRVLR
jgi:hypothetical protein